MNTAGVQSLLFLSRKLKCAKKSCYCLAFLCFCFQVETSKDIQKQGICWDIIEYCKKNYQNYIKYKLSLHCQMVERRKKQEKFAKSRCHKTKGSQVSLSLWINDEGMKKYRRHWACTIGGGGGTTFIPPMWRCKNNINKNRSISHKAHKDSKQRWSADTDFPPKNKGEVQSMTTWKTFISDLDPWPVWVAFDPRIALCYSLFQRPSLSPDAPHHRVTDTVFAGA